VKGSLALKSWSSNLSPTPLHPQGLVLQVCTAIPGLAATFNILHFYYYSIKTIFWGISDFFSLTLWLFRLLSFQNICGFHSLYVCMLTPVWSETHGLISLKCVGTELAFKALSWTPC
jgi:hypothetical protein